MCVCVLKRKDDESNNVGGRELFFHLIFQIFVGRGRGKRMLDVPICLFFFFRQSDI